MPLRFMGKWINSNNRCEVTDQTQTHTHTHTHTHIYYMRETVTGEWQQDPGTASGNYLDVSPMTNID